MTTLTLETAEERELWRLAAVDMDPQQADIVVRAYRERCAPTEASPGFEQLAQAVLGDAYDLDATCAQLLPQALTEVGRLRDASPPAEEPEHIYETMGLDDSKAHKDGRGRAARTVRVQRGEEPDRSGLDALREVVESDAEYREIRAEEAGAATGPATCDHDEVYPGEFCMDCHEVKPEYHAQGNPPSEVLDAVRANYPRAEPSGVPTGPGWWWGRISSSDAFEPWEVESIGGELCFDWPEYPDPPWLPESRRANVSRAQWDGPCLQGSAPSMDKVDFWDAVNEYVEACGGDVAANVLGNTARQRAVARVEGCLQGSAPADGVDWYARACEVKRAHRKTAERHERLTRAVKDALGALEAVGLDCSAIRAALDAAKGDA